MLGVTACLVDTNVLLRLARPNDPSYSSVQQAVFRLRAAETKFYVSMQNITEFWNVCTRPAAQNGFGLSVVEAGELLDVIEATVTVLPDTDRVYTTWRVLITRHGVRGVQVHDARLAAFMEAHEIETILTLNTGDFTRFDNVRALHPRSVE